MYKVGQLFMFNVDDINGRIDKRIIKIRKKNDRELKEKNYDNLERFGKDYSKLY